MPWRGNVTFGNGWTAYSGTRDQQTPHAHSALQLVVAQSGRVTLESCGHSHSAPGLAVAPGVLHLTLPSGGPLIFVYADPHSLLGRYMASLMGADRIAPAPRSIVTALRKLGPTTAALQKLVPGGVSMRPLENRLSLALEHLEHDLGSPGAIARVAREIGISPARLRVLARAELGLPLAQRIVWRKLARALAAVAQGRSLADAALVGEFSDQAHFSRIMRRLFGVTPREASVPLRAQLGSVSGVERNRSG